MTKLAEESRFKKSNAGKVPAGSRKSRAAFFFSLSFVLLTNLKQAEGLGALTGDQNKSLNDYLYCFAGGKCFLKKNQTKQQWQMGP